MMYPSTTTSILHVLLGIITSISWSSSFDNGAFGLMEREKVNERSKRAFLVYPGPVTKLQYILGVGLPIDLEDYAIAIGHIFKASYLVPTNASDYTNPGVIYARKKRSMARWDVYQILSEVADLHGFGGRSCVLRTICELADTPLNKKHGLMGELLHTLFTPSTTAEDINHHSDNEYFSAHKLGKQFAGKCHRFFKDCAINFADLFSKVYEVNDNYE